MNKERLRQKLTEMTAYKFDMLEQQINGTYPTLENHGKERYIGNNPPPPYVELNTFKNNIDDHVTIIMMILEEELKEATEDHDIEIQAAYRLGKYEATEE